MTEVELYPGRVSPLGVGTIPLVGDLFDMGFKANTRNLRLLRQIETQRAEGLARDADLAAASKRYLLALGAALGVGLLLVLVGTIALIVWLVRLIGA